MNKVILQNKHSIVSSDYIQVIWSKGICVQNLWPCGWWACTGLGMHIDMGDLVEDGDMEQIHMHARFGACTIESCKAKTPKNLSR